MKIKTITLSLVLLFAFSHILYADELPRLAVRAFEDRSVSGDAPASAIMDMMVTELDKARVFELVEREHLDYVAAEIRLGQSGLMDESTAPAMGMLKGAQYTMTGAITLYYYNDRASAGITLPNIGSIFGTAAAKTAYVDLDIRIIDNETSQIVYSSTRRGVATQESREPGLLNSGFDRTYGGILAAAARDAIRQHVDDLARRTW